MTERVATRALPPATSRWARGAPRSVLLAVVIGISLVGTLIGGAGFVTPTALPSSAPAHASAVAGGVHPTAAPAPWGLRWLGTPQSVMSLQNGYWDNLGQLWTVGNAAYTCYANASPAGGLAPNNLYLLTNESGSWQPYLAGAPLSAMGGLPTCSIVTGTLGNFAETGTIAVGGHPDAIAFDGGSGNLYVANGQSSNLSVLHPPDDQVVATIPTPGLSEPDSIAEDSANGELYVSYRASNVVLAIDPGDRAIVASTAVGSVPTSVTFDSRTGDLYVTNFASDNVSVIDGATNGIVATIPVGPGPVAAAFDDADGNLFVASAPSPTSDGSVSVIDGATRALVATVPVGVDPDSVAYDSGNGAVYVANYLSDNVSVIVATTDRIVTEIPVGPTPSGLAYDAEDGDVFVADGGQNSVGVIDGASDTLLATLPEGGADATAIAYDPSTNDLYLPNLQSNDVSVVGEPTVEFIAYLSPQNTSNGTLPSVQLVYNPSGSPLGPWVNVSVDPPGLGYVGSLGGNVPDGPTVAIWDNSTIVIAYQNEPPIFTNAPSPEVWVQSLPLNALPLRPGGPTSEPWFVQIPTSGDGVNGLLADRYPVVTTDPAGVQLVFQRGCGCDNGSPEVQLAYYQGTVGIDRDVYVANEGSDNVSVISETTGATVASIPIGVQPTSAVYDSQSGDLYVSNTSLDPTGNGAVSVISGVTNSVVARIPVGEGPYGLAYDDSNGDVYVTNTLSNTVSVIWGLTNNVIATISLYNGTGASPTPAGVAYDSADGDVYVADIPTDTVTVINASNDSVVATIPVGSSPHGVTFDVDTGSVYVMNSGSDNVSVIQTTSVVATVPVGSDPFSATVDPQNGTVYVVNVGSGNVSVLQGVTNSVVATIPVGAGPRGATYDPINGNVYVSNTGSGNVSVVRGTTETVVGSVAVGSAPEGLAFDNGSGTIAWQNGTGDPYVIAGYPGSGNLGMSIGFLSTPTGEDFAAYTNASSVGLQLDAAVGSGTTWSNVSLGSALASPSALYETPGVAEDACGLSIGDTLNTNSELGTVVPAVWTYNDSAWTSSIFGPTNASNEVPAFVDVAAQGQYVDTLFVNQPGGGASGDTVFYADQALCTNATLNSVTTTVTSPSVSVGNSSIAQGQAFNLTGVALSGGVSYAWSVEPSSVGVLNRTNGTGVNFTGEAIGNATLLVTAWQSGWVVHGMARIAVTQALGRTPPPPAPPGQGVTPPPGQGTTPPNGTGPGAGNGPAKILGLPPDDAYILAGAAGAAGVVGVGVAVHLRRPPTPPAPGLSPGTGSPPPGSPPPPSPPSG